MRALLITGDERRHRYVATQLAEEIGLSAIVSESKAKSAAAVARPTGPMARHLAERDAVEAEILGETRFPSGVETLALPTGAANDPSTADWVDERKPDVVFLYGSSIIRPPLLDRYDGRMINMHLGLSPYYRGAATNFWALVENCPEAVGATIHLAVRKVDAGAVLTQMRPDIEPGDRAHHIGTRAIISGVCAMAAAAKRYLSGEIEPATQDLSIGKVFRKSDASDEAVLRLWRNFEDGMVPRYLAEREARCEAMPIVEN